MFLLIPFHNWRRSDANGSTGHIIMLNNQRSLLRNLLIQFSVFNSAVKTAKRKYRMIGCQSSSDLPQVIFNWRRSALSTSVHGATVYFKILHFEHCNILLFTFFMQNNSYQYSIVTYLLEELLIVCSRDSDPGTWIY